MNQPEETKLFNELSARASAGDVEAQYEIGWRSAIGMGLPENEPLAVEFLKRAAAGGHLLAQNNLGARYVSGEGVPRDLLEAYKWFSLAFQQGDRKAGKNRDVVAAQLTPEQQAAADQLLSQKS